MDPAGERARHSILAPLILTLAAGLGPGCVVGALAAGVAGTVYVQGDLEADVEGSPEEVCAALEAGLADLHLPVLAAAADEAGGRIESVAEDEGVWISLAAEEPGLTHVSIRVGTFGRPALAGRIRDAALARLDLRADAGARAAQEPTRTKRPSEGTRLASTTNKR